MEKADKLRSTRAAVSAIQLSSEKALPPRFWLVARAQTIRSKKSPDGSKSVLPRSAKRLISSKRWRREVLFRQQSRDQARARTRSDGCAAASRRSSPRRVSSQRRRRCLDESLGKRRGLSHRHGGCSDQP